MHLFIVTVTFRAQRLSASTNGSRRQVRPYRRDCLVLNAFRHQRMDHAKRNGHDAIVGMCSTPFGINEWITRIVLCGTSAATSAQRLSASTNGSHRLTGGASAAGTGCSTPFGINEWITWSSRRSRPPVAAVLNAFRHQRMDHQQFAESVGLARIEVLNAFRHQRMDHLIAYCTISRRG